VPQPSPTPVNQLRQDIESLGFPVSWEGDVLLVTLADERTRFDTGQATLKPESIQRLGSLAAVLLKYPGNAIQVDGHTDSHGKEELNRSLSQRRAEAVRKQLERKGVPASDFSAVTGHGPDLPVGDNNTEEGRAMNRRVELRLRFHALQSPAQGGAQWVSPTAALAAQPTLLPSPKPSAAVSPVR
jgi:outer membrane protein OmpA-like peptidoglycan-associated protein